MRAAWRPCVLALLLVVVSASAQDYKLAPPAEDLDRRAADYVNARRITAVVLIGGLIAGGAIASYARRRARRSRSED